MSLIKSEELPTCHSSQDPIPTFVRKTYDILEEGRFSQLIDWNPEGTALVIKNPSEFSQIVLPVYFKHNNFTSFVRQLNMYNFHKKRTHNLEHIYVHEFFQRNNRHLLQQIKRKTQDHAQEESPKPLKAQKSLNKDSNLTALIEENRLFKSLYQEAMSQLAKLEHKVQELRTENHSLLSLGKSSKRENGLTQELLPMTLGRINLKLEFGDKADSGLFRSISGASTEDSSNSPLLEQENEEFSQEGSPYTGLKITRGETSVGRMLDAWNSGFEGEEIFCEDDQNADEVCFLNKNRLGKRQCEIENDDEFEDYEPVMKRHQSCDFGERLSDSKDDVESFFDDCLHSRRVSFSM